MIQQLRHCLSSIPKHTCTYNETTLYIFIKAICISISFIVREGQMCARAHQHQFPNSYHLIMAVTYYLFINDFAISKAL